MTSPDTFIPIDRRLALAAGQELPERTHGAALFADVSGFTPLTLALMRELGPKRGAEAVLEYLNPVYDSLLQCLHRYGGAAIGFSGDATTCWLAGDDGRRAIACALEMQAAMSAYQDLRTAGGTPFSLGIKVAIAVGPARRFVAGAPEIQLLDVLVGDTLMRMAAAEHMAERGEVVVEAAALERLGGLAMVREWRSDEAGDRYGVIQGLAQSVPLQPWPDLSEDILDESQARRWLNAAVFERVRAGGAFLAELRPAVALFVRFLGLDYENDPGVSAKLDAYMRWVEAVIDRYDGCLLQLTIGDKGSYYYVAFGAPVAHADNAVRALAAALDLRAGSLDFAGIEQVQLGLSAGRMWAGAYGGSQGRTYGVLGNEVNMAARLMANAAPGQIMLSEPVLAAGQRHYFFNSLGKIKVKGRDDPLPVWEVTGRRLGGADEWALFSQPAVGRSEELGRLEALAAAVVEGAGQVVRLVGEAGMGKSHLAAQLGRGIAERHGFRLALGDGQSISRLEAYRPWRHILGALLGLDPQAEVDALARLDQVMAARPEWAARAPLLGDLLRLPVPDNPTTAAMDPQARQRALVSLVVEMLQAWAAEQPLCLALENTHWLDEASLALAFAVAQQAVRNQPVLLLLIHRPEQSGEAPLLPELDTLPHLAAVRLNEMDDSEVAALMQARLGQAPQPLVLSIVQRLARGNPFFVGELLDALRQSGQLTRGEDGAWDLSADLFNALRAAGYLHQSDAGWRLRPGADLSTVKLGIPDSMQAVILARLDRLPEAHKLTLKVSSVIGHYFDLHLVARTHPDEKDVRQLQVEAQAMEAEEVVNEDRPERATYTFRHHSTQEVAYETLLYAQRQQLHRTVALALHEQEPGAVVPIAYHAFLGQDWPLALEYNQRAGEQARRLSANQQGVELFQKALDSAVRLPDGDTGAARRQIHLALGELLVTLGRHGDAEPHLRQALELAEAQSEHEAQARACRWQARSHQLRSQYPEARTWVERGLAALAAGGRASVQESELRLELANIHYYQGDYDPGLAQCAAAQQLADEAARARALNTQGLIEIKRGRLDAAIEHFEAALEVYLRQEDLGGQAVTHNSLGLCFDDRGPLSRADEHYRQALALFTQIGDQPNQLRVNNNLGNIALTQGRLEAALGYFEKALRIVAATGGAVRPTAIMQLNIGWTHLRRGDLARAEDHLRRAEALLVQAGLKEALVVVRRLLAEARLQGGQLAEAEVLARQALEQARELRQPKEISLALRLLGEHARQAGRLEAAEALLTEGLEAARGAGVKWEITALLISLGRLRAAQGRPAQARASLAEAEQTLAAYGEAAVLQSEIQGLRQALALQ